MRRKYRPGISFFFFFGVERRRENWFVSDEGRGRSRRFESALIRRCNFCHRPPAGCFIPVGRTTTLVTATTNTGRPLLQTARMFSSVSAHSVQLPTIWGHCCRGISKNIVICAPGSSPNFHFDDPLNRLLLAQNSRPI